MRELRKWAWAALIATAAAAPGAAQQGTITSGGGATTGNLGGVGGLTGGGAGQLGGGGGGQGGGGAGGGLGTSSGGMGTALQGTQLQTMQAAPKLSAPTGTASSSLQKSNFLAGYYANPYFQGTISSGTSATPGGFGMVLMPVTAGSGAAGGRGGIGGAGGRGGQSSSNQSGILIPLPVQINYSAQMRFPTPPVAAGRMQTELRLVIDGTSQIANPKGVQIVTDDANNVTLRGTVKDDDEARLVEGLVRLTPGVGAIKNELTATASAGPPGK